MKYKGLSTHRFKQNPEEKRFAKRWNEINEHGSILDYLLDSRKDRTGRPPEVTDEAHTIAATVVQWLGSPVGQCFLSSLGYSRMNAITKIARS